MSYIYMISYSIGGGELKYETISAGSIEEAKSLFKINMEMDLATDYKIHSIWLLIYENKEKSNG